MKKNHYGITVDSEVPTTGVFNCNKISYIWDDAIESIDLTFEEALKEHKEHCVDEVCREWNHEGFIQGYESDGDTYLIGFKRTENGLFEPDETTEFSAILRQDSGPTLQVVRSKWLIQGALCSPCYPGQVDGDNDGDFLGYAPPPDLFDEEGKDIASKIFHKDQKEYDFSVNVHIKGHKPLTRSEALIELMKLEMIYNQCSKHRIYITSKDKSGGE